MKFSILALIVMAAGAAQAAVPSFKPCSKELLISMKKDIIEKQSEGLFFPSLLKNTKGQVVGYFITDNEESIYAEVCEYMNGDELSITVGSEWYYWESSLRSNPKTWAKGSALEISQDEGRAQMKVLKASKTGAVVVEFTLQGWGSDADISVDMRKDVLVFVPIK